MGPSSRSISSGIAAVQQAYPLGRVEPGLPPNSFSTHFRHPGSDPKSGKIVENYFLLYSSYSNHSIRYLAEEFEAAILLHDGAEEIETDLFVLFLIKDDDAGVPMDLEGLVVGGLVVELETSER